MSGLKTTPAISTGKSQWFHVDSCKVNWIVNPDGLAEPGLAHG